MLILYNIIRRIIQIILIFLIDQHRNYVSCNRNHALCAEEQEDEEVYLVRVVIRKTDNIHSLILNQIENIGISFRNLNLLNYRKKIC